MCVYGSLSVERSLWIARREGAGWGGTVENQVMGGGRGQDILEGRVFERELIIH